MAATAPATLATFKEALSRLVAHFSSQQPYFTGPDYNEAKLREDFLNPFFAALGRGRSGAKSNTGCAALENAIRKTDRDIDQLVYQLHGLTPEEIALVDGIDS